MARDIANPVKHLLAAGYVPTPVATLGSPAGSRLATEYNYSGKQFIVMEYPSTGGWDIFIPVANTIRADDTIDALIEYLEDPKR